MMIEIIKSSDNHSWRTKLNSFDRVDVCHMPEYHEAYLTRMDKSEALLWTYKDGEKSFAYPFFKAPVTLTGKDKKLIPTGSFDISSVYGFSGPLSNSEDPSFLKKAWSEFDSWSSENKILCEFIRFSVYSQNFKLAHPNCEVSANRPISISHLDGRKDYLETLPSKTRNMVRRAQKDGLVVKEVAIKEGLNEFRQLYKRTMERNNATEFFSYTDEYYERLMKLPEGEITLHGVYSDNQMVAGAIGLIHKEFGFYHLGASENSRIGSGNLALFGMVQAAAEKGVTYFNVGGGSSTSAEDALFSFKRSNGNAVDQFYIGKRIINRSAYTETSQEWMKVTEQTNLPTQLQFYR